MLHSHTPFGKFYSRQGNGGSRPLYEKLLPLSKIKSSFKLTQPHQLSGTLLCYGSSRRIMEPQLSFRLEEHSSPGSEESLSRDISLERKPERTPVITEQSQQTAKVEFSIKFRANYGQQLKLIGTTFHFGSWSISRCPAMIWHKDDIWKRTLDLPVEHIYEYKYIVVDSQGANVVHWQQGNNCVLAVSLKDKIMHVRDNWTGAPGAIVASRGRGVSTKEERLIDWATELKSSSNSSNSLELKQSQHLLESSQEEIRILKQEATRLKSELRMASITQQTTGKQLQELQRKNRRLQEVVVEQESVHKSVMQQTLKLLSDDSAVAVARTGSLRDDGEEFEAPIPAAETNGRAPMDHEKKSRSRRRYRRRKKRTLFT
eukprot:g5854.t1